MNLNRIDVYMGDEHDSDIIIADKIKTKLPNFVIARLGGDSSNSYHSLSVLRMLESKGISMINNAAGIEKASDKLYSQLILEKHKLPVPKSMLDAILKIVS